MTHATTVTDTTDLVRLPTNAHRVSTPVGTLEGSAILRIAGEARADLIVMGTHGRTGLGRLLMGSVAEQVVRRAPCPVLTVKAPFPVASSAAEPAVAVAGVQ